MNKTNDDYIVENRRIRKENKNLILENFSLKEENKKLKTELDDAKECITTYKDKLFKLQLKLRELTGE